jgi:hypothetical protein
VIYHGLFIKISAGGDKKWIGVQGNVTILQTWAINTGI